MPEEDTRNAPYPAEEILEYWDSGARVERLRRAVKIALKPDGVKQAKFADYAEFRFAPEGVSGLRDALGRFSRGKLPGKSVPAPIKCHVYLVTLFYAYQRRLSGDVFDELSQYRSLFAEYDQLLDSLGSPLLTQLSDPTGRPVGSEPGVDPEYPRVKLKENMDKVQPLHLVLSLVNVDQGRHASANMRFYNKLPQDIPAHLYQWYVIVSLHNAAASPRLSLLVLRSGHRDDHVITYTHRQKRFRIAQGQSNGVVCLMDSGHTLFGGFVTGAGMETIFIPSGQEGRDQLDITINSIGPDDRPFTCPGLMLRSSKLLYDNNPWYIDQDLSLCTTLIADGAKAVGQLRSSVL